MADAASEWSRRFGPSWLISPTPRRPFYSAWGRPLVRDLLDAGEDEVTLVAPSVDHVFELGTAEYRARCYARAVMGGVPPGVPLVLSDDPNVWRGAALVADRNPMIGVLHADDEAYYALAKRYRDVVAAFVCVSSRIERATRSRLGGTAAPIMTTIPCGIPLPDSVPSRRGDGGVRITWAGRMDAEQKRVGDLVPIIAGARAAGLAATLDIVGDGPERPAVETAAAEAGVDSQITFHGWQPVATVIDILRQSDVLLLTSNYEGMPIAVMEALASGCAVVSTLVSGVEDYEGTPLASNALWTFPVGDIDAAVDRLRDATRVPRATRERAARQLAEAEFAIETCMARYEALLGSVCAQPRRDVEHTGNPMVMAYARSAVIAAARRLRLHMRGQVAGRYAEHG
jgi:glycosyltransferase involved in cell wall biosynthesis